MKEIKGKIIKSYIIIQNNEEEFEDYGEWIKEVYLDKNKAEKRFLELIRNNCSKEVNKIKKAKYDENIEAFRLEEYMVVN